MNLNLDSILSILAGAVGLVLAVLITVAIIYFVRKPLEKVLSHLVADETVVKAGVTFVLILIGLQGAAAALRFITQSQLNVLIGGLISLVTGIASTIQWLIGVVALLFIGYAIAGLSKKPEL